MTRSLHAPIIVCGGPQGSRASITRIMGARPAMQLRLLHTEFFRAFRMPGSVVLIRGLSRSSCLFHHAARDLADALQFAALSCPGSHDRNQPRKGTHDHGNFTRKYGKPEAHV